jgi:hypothetical protein
MGGLISLDFNGDGHLDLADSASDGVSILLGNGDGTFTTSVHYGGASSGSLTTGDFNGDGYIDFTTANWQTNDVTVFLSSGCLP